MATGKLSFSGATSAVVFHAILERDPVSPLQLNATLPPKLQEIIEKLLEKDRDLRCQSAADLRGDLKRLKRDVESGRHTTPLPSSSPETIAATTAPPRSPTSSGSAVAVAREHKIGASVATLVTVAVLGSAASGVYVFLHRARPVPFQNFSVSKVTDSGDAASAAISPDASASSL